MGHRRYSHTLSLDSAPMTWSGKNAIGEKYTPQHFCLIGFPRKNHKTCFFFRIDVIVRRNEYTTKAKSVLFSILLPAFLGSIPCRASLAVDWRRRKNQLLRSLLVLVTWSPWARTWSLPWTTFRLLWHRLRCLRLLIKTNQSGS